MIAHSAEDKTCNNQKNKKLTSLQVKRFCTVEQFGGKMNIAPITADM